MHNIERELWGAPREIEVTRRNFFGSGFLPVANFFGFAELSAAWLPYPQRFNLVFMLNFAIRIN